MITIISGTNRFNSNTLKVSKTCLDILLASKIEAQLFSLEDLPKGFLNPNMFEEKTKGFDELIQKNIHSADRFLFVIPEYHGSFPGVLKTFMDAISSKDVMDKKAMIVGVASGHAGGLRPLSHFTDVLHHLRVEVFSRKPKLSGVDKLLDINGISDEKTLTNLKSQIELFMKF